MVEVMFHSPSIVPSTAMQILTILFSGEEHTSLVEKSEGGRGVRAGQGRGRDDGGVRRNGRGELLFPEP